MGILLDICVELLTRKPLGNMWYACLVLQRRLCFKEFERHFRSFYQITIPLIQLPENKGKEDEQQSEYNSEIWKVYVSLEGRNKAGRKQRRDRNVKIECG